VGAYIGRLHGRLNAQHPICNGLIAAQHPITTLLLMVLVEQT
jgi:hypothetical protein